MKLYTRQGDGGDTRRPGGKRIRKSDAFCEAVGTLDELGAAVGLCLRAAGDQSQAAVREALAPLAEELSASAAMLAAAETNAPPRAAVDPAAVTRMEKQIDAACAQLPGLTGFILQGGCELACRLHAARTVCRRAERRVVAAGDAGTAVSPAVLKYLNRLGDLLFALARRANQNADVPDATWKAP